MRCPLPLLLGALLLAGAPGDTAETPWTVPFAEVPGGDRSEPGLRSARHHQRRAPAGGRALAAGPVGACEASGRSPAAGGTRRLVPGPAPGHRHHRRARAPVHAAGLGEQAGRPRGYRPSRVIREVVQGPAPLLALGVVISWPAVAGAPSEYSYEDTLSTPHLKVTQKRVITYQLLDFGDVVVFDRMEGLHGRPTTGALGVLFSALGEGRVVDTGWRSLLTAPRSRADGRGRPSSRWPRR